MPSDVGADHLDQAFWDGCARHELRLHTCAQCGRAFFPATSCPEHGWEAMAWQAASGRGVVHTYTVFHKAYLPWLEARVPYAIAVVRLDEGAFFHTDIVDTDLAAVCVGAPVEVVYEDLTNGWTIPHFRITA
jgi:uncharacterized OB-fold protein